MKVLLIAMLCACACLGAQSHARQLAPDDSIQSLIGKRAESILPSLVQLRRNIHQHPELSGHEQRTSALVSEYLTNLGLEVEAGIGGFGVVGMLKGAEPGPVVAWRADMDALADNSTDSVNFRSVTPGVRHICGHDVHTTIGLGIANVLSSIRKNLSGTVLFVFQPAEENFTGAKAMIDAGVFGRIKPEAVFALHIGALPTGVVATKPREMFACRARIAIELKGTADEKEVLRICAAFLKELHTPRGINIFSVPLDDNKQGLFNPRGALTNYLALEGAPKIEKQGDSILTVKSSVLASSDSILASAVASLREVINRSPLKDRLLRIQHSYRQPAVVNDPGLTARSMEILQAIYGSNRIIPLYGVVPGFNDDFAYFQKECKGVYFFLGGSDFEKGVLSMPHTPRFMVDEECIKSGVAYFSSLLFELTRR